MKWAMVRLGERTDFPQVPLALGIASGFLAFPIFIIFLSVSKARLLEPIPKLFSSLHGYLWMFIALRLSALRPN